MRSWPVLWVLAACSNPADTDTAVPFTFAEPDAGPAWLGPGGPARSFDEAELNTACAVLSGGAEDHFHHNLVTSWRGYLVLPWAPEWSGGGISLYDVSDPCEPVVVGEGYHQYMRETHSMGFVHLPEDDPHAGDYVAVNGLVGVQIWDLTDPTAPTMLSYLNLMEQGVFYPDSYARPVLSVSWQYPWLYLATADNGVMVVDATDPADPRYVTTYTWDPVLRAGGVFAMGTLLFVSSAEQSTHAVLDISIPDDPQPLPGGLFQSLDAEGEAKEAYHGNIAGDWFLFARKEGGGGFMAMDLSDPGNATFAAEGFTEGGNGGYVFYDEGFVFVGESNWATIYDARDPADVQLHAELDLDGDLDTITPYGNVVVLSVDDEPVDDIASVIVPWQQEPDTTGPTLLRVVPADGETGVSTTARIGLSFDEYIDPSTVFPGSVRLYDDAGNAIDGWGSGQEGLAHYTPKEPLTPGTTYTLEVMAGGIVDVNGNPVEATTTTTFTTAGGR